MARTDRDEKSYLMGRTRTGRTFNRAALKFEGEWQAFPVADLKPEQIERILNEPMLEARLATAAEVERMVKIKRAAIDESMTKAELAQHIVKLEGRLNDQAERIRELEIKLTGDRPPRSTADLPPPTERTPPGVPQPPRG